MDICIQTGEIISDFGIKEGFRMIKEAGFDGIDLNIDHALRAKDIYDLKYPGYCIFEKQLSEINLYYQELIENIQINNLRVSQAHAIFPVYLFDHPDLLDYAIAILKKTILFLDTLKCKNVVIHGICLEARDNVNDTESIKTLNIKLYESLIDTLKQTNICICLENLFTEDNNCFYPGHCANPNEAKEFIDYLNSKAQKECFGLCLDTGHLNIIHKSFTEYMPILADRIKCFHIHDNNGYDDYHLMPFAGSINWEEFCKQVKQIGYDGDLSFETFAQTKVVTKFDRELVLDYLKLIHKIGETFKNKIEA